MNKKTILNFLSQYSWIMAWGIISAELGLRISDLTYWIYTFILIILVEWKAAHRESQIIDKLKELEDDELNMEK